MRPVQLFETEDGKIVDGYGMEYNLPRKAWNSPQNPQYPAKGLDIDGSVTVTGNLTVQQSDWVYLRGPITGSGAVINGAITASTLWVRNTAGHGMGEMEGMGWIKVDDDIEVRGVSYWEVFTELKRAVRELKSRIEELESSGNKK